MRCAVRTAASTSNSEFSSNTIVAVIDTGVNYIIRGHNARLSAMYSRTGVESFKTHNFTVGLQVQF